MSDITVVEFENAARSEEVYLSSELEDGPPYKVHGVALGPGDMTKGKSGIKKKWPAGELRKSADSLQGTNLVVDHENNVHGVIGRVTKSGYKKNDGVIYEAELYDEDIAEKVEKGLLEVSIRGLHQDVEDLEKEEETDALIVEDIEFKNLSVVPSGAAPSNTLEMGEHASLSAAELASFTEDIEPAELQEEIEPGMWVKWGENRGVTISQVQDGEIEVDIYEEKDGQWRSAEETTMVDTGSLEEWDIDEDNIGPASDDEKDEEQDSDEEENSDSEELVSEGDKVEWDEGAAQGVVVERKTDGCFNEKIDGDVEVCADENEAVVLIEIVKEGERTGTMVAHKEGTTNTADFSLADGDSKDKPNPPEFEEGDMVQWQVAPSMMGKIVHAPSNQDIVMVEVMEERDGEMTETGFTITAGYSDLQHFEEESDGESDEESDEERSEEQNADVKQDEGNASSKKETDSELSQDLSEDSDTTVQDLIQVLASVAEGASTTSDVPVDSAEPDHEPMGSMENMFNMFMEDGGSPDSTLSEFFKWLNQKEELEHNLEGVDDALDDEEAIRRMKENDAAYMAFVYQDEELEETFDDYPEAASENAQMALDAREETDNPNDCGTDVGWKRANQLASGESLSRDTIAKMSAFNRHRSNSEMDDEEGKADCGWMMWKAWGGDEGVDWAQRKLDQIEEENVDSEELQDYEMHTPDWSGTTEKDWSTPDMEDFDTDDLSEIADHFLISTTGFPPENFTDLKLPVVEPNGDLNVNALAAVKGGRGVSAVDGLSSDMEEKIVEWVNSTANDEFDREWGMDEEEMKSVEQNASLIEEGMKFFSTVNDSMVTVTGVNGNVVRVEADDGSQWKEERDNIIQKLADGDWEHSGHTDSEEMSSIAYYKPTQSSTVGGVRVLPGDDLRYENLGASDADSLTQYNVTTMNDEIKELIDELSEPVAVEADEIEELREKADRFEEMSENLEALRERTDILDDVSREQVEELRDGDEPVVVESARYEELQSEAEQVKGVYAAQLSDNYDAFDADELADRFSIEELREKFEDEFGAVEEELADSSEAEPRSQDPSEEELEEETASDEEELSDEIKQKQEEMRNKILGGD